MEEDKKFDQDRLKELQGQVDHVQGLLMDNIEAVIGRGEQLEVLVHRADDLHAAGTTFNKIGRRVQKKSRCGNAQLKLWLAIAALLIIYFIISCACGGPLWSTCLSEMEEKH